MNHPVPVATQSHEASAVVRHLARAAVRLRHAETSRAWKRFFSNVPLIAAATLGINAAEIAMARLTGTTMILPWMAGTAGGAAFVIVGVLVHAMSKRPRANWDELAERLDLAAGDQNAIATALDLIRCGERSGFAARAIADGINAAEKFGVIQPAVSSPVVQRPSPRYLVLASIIALALACWIPANRFGQSSNTVAIDPQSSLSGRQTATDDRGPSPATSNNPNVAPAPVAAPAPSTGSTGNPQQPGDRSNQSSMKPGLANSSEISASETKSATPSASSDGSNPQSKQPQAHPHKSQTPGVGQPVLSVASLGSASGDSANSRGSPAGGSGGQSEPSQSQNAPTSDENVGAGTPNGKLPSDQTPALGRPGEKGSGRSPAFGQGAAKTDQPGEGTGGNGQGSGQSPPKKSRSVAPLMLGTRQPDLLQGKQLPGPDQRIKVEVPPQPSLESPSAAVTATARQGPESNVDVYIVPPDSRRAVDQYFQQFHQDSAATATDSN